MTTDTKYLANTWERYNTFDHSISANMLIKMGKEKKRLAVVQHLLSRDACGLVFVIICYFNYHHFEIVARYANLFFINVVLEVPGKLDAVLVLAISNLLCLMYGHVLGLKKKNEETKIDI